MRPISRRALAAHIAAAVSITALLSAPRLAAQDTQYWSDAYGTQARLLGGVVIGSDQDISAVYYNPGGIALADSLSLLISLNALRYASLSYSISNTPNVPSSSGWSALSNMFAAAVPIGGKDSHQRLAFSLLRRQSFVFGAQLRAIPLDSFLPTPPPPPTFSVGNALVNQSMSEVWAGATWAMESDKQWGYGASLYIPIRSQTFSQSLTAQVVAGNGKNALGAKEYDFSYYNWAVLAKFGVAYKGDHWSAGLTLTTPRLSLFGGSNVGATQSYIDQGVTGSGSSQIATNYQPKLSASYKSALAIGFGVSKLWTNTQLNFSAEWFAAVPKFTIIPAVPFTPQFPSSSPSIPMALTAQYQQVFNWGLGISRRLDDHWKLYGAFKTDKTSIPPDVKSVGTLVNFDLTHADFGAQATIGRAAIILGLDMAWGSHDNVAPGGDPAPGLPAMPTVDLSFFALTGAIGFKISY